MVYFPTKSIGRKVFISFFVLLALGIVAFLYSYLRVVQLSNTLSNAPASTQKLTLINQTLVKIYESEANAKLYAASGDASFLKSYVEQNKDIDSNLQLLSNISIDAEQQILLGNILIIQNQKEKVVGDIITLNQKKNKRGDYKSIIKSKSDSSEVELKHKVYSTIGSTPPKEQVVVRKRTFFQRFKALFKDDETPVVPTHLGMQKKVDSITVQQTKKDNSLVKLRSQLSSMQAQENINEKLFKQQEVDLLKKDKLLTDRMLYHITMMSKQEIKINNQKLAQFNSAARSYMKKLILLGVSSFFVVIFFLILIFRDIRLSARMQKQLEDSNERIQDLLKVKERFLANMSHEIRTPLSAIMGFSDFLLNKKKYSEEEIMAINSSAKHLHSIVNEILDYSKVESNAVELEFSNFSLDRFLNEIITEMSIKAKEKGVGLVLNLTGIPQKVNLDRLRLKQVMLNLISNAIKFTDSGEVVVNGYVQDEKLKIDVVDTGIGIPASAQEKIFEEFTQADGSVARKFGGTGLGLSISRKLVILMGGNLVLKSEEGVGSCFSVEFSLEKIHIEEIGIHNPVVASQPISKKVLFIDDDSYVRLLVGKIFAANGINFDIAESGAKGVEMCRKGIYGLVVTDLHMPGMSGIEVVKAIKENNPTAKVLFLSADVSSSMTNEMMAIGANGILQKPFTEMEIITAISSIMQVPDVDVRDDKKPLCNLSKVTAFIGDDREELKQIVDAFVVSADESIAFIASNNRVGNEVPVADKAHKLLTSFRQFEITDGVEYLREIEKCRHGKLLSEVQSEIEELQKLWVGVKSYLNEVV
ncbi:ATP-binding protein [uncultured Acetobacteroides sp.]|uniref:ATP-binding protein n=1 Tax=uncultured Acetobacteroides sp. TaxID=1760811 RepID=UPI0029F4F91B|nr:ATP-binding protein [uncultured Acetobacteroides sp.]